ncbi:LPS export ABC transporter periplasmic protein LptC [Sporomusa aerivorans]|uniref:LPS export ABC transporter periplasmic protein LptC n=1 Tax=Sporomusa aerivorans TaxID=204936 RepID=UPI00352AACDA
MTKNKNIGLALAVLIVAGGLYYLLWGAASRDSAENPEAVPTQVNTRITFAGSSIVEEKDGKKLWELKADTIETDIDGKTAYLKNLQGTLYQDKGGKVDLLALQAQVDMKTHDITMQGDVKATSSDGAVFTAPEARWEGVPKSFSGTGGVTLTRNNTVITGDTIKTDEKLEKVRVSGNARVITGGEK